MENRIEERIIFCSNAYKKILEMTPPKMFQHIIGYP